MPLSSQVQPVVLAPLPWAHALEGPSLHGWGSSADEGCLVRPPTWLLRLACVEPFSVPWLCIGREGPRWCSEQPRGGTRGTEEPHESCPVPPCRRGPSGKSERKSLVMGREFTWEGWLIKVCVGLGEEVWNGP